MLMDINLNEIYKAQLSEHDFNRLSNFIYKEYGIKMPPSKKIMLQSRLQKRLRELNITSFKEYCDIVFSPEGADEIIHMIDVVSTNKTDFFREPNHFAFMQEVILPEFVAEKNNRLLKIWSAGCSSGEEPYTIAIVVSQFFETQIGYDFQILGTDISTRILQKAIDAIYSEDRIVGIPLEIKKKYFLKSKDPAKKLVRIIPQLRSKVTFQRLNLMSASYDVKDMFDIIFCRNVLIYFDRETQEKVISKLCTRLKTGGYFFLGHSESIMGMQLPLSSIKPTIFVKV